MTTALHQTANKTHRKQQALGLAFCMLLAVCVAWALTHRQQPATQIQPVRAFRLTGLIDFQWFSPDGSMLAVIRRDQSSLVLDARSGRVLHAFPGKTATIIFPASGNTVYAVSDRQIQSWDRKTNKTVHAFPIVGKLITQNHDWVVTQTPANVIVWSLSTGRRVHTLPLRGDLRYGIENDVDLSSDNSQLAVADVFGSGGVTVYETTHWHPIFTLSSQNGHTSAVHFSWASNLLVVASGIHQGKDYGAQTLTLWDTDTWQPRRTLSTDYDEDIMGIHFSHDGKYLLTAGLVTTPSKNPDPLFVMNESVTNLWEVSSGREVLTLSKEDMMAVLSYDGKMLATSTGPRADIYDTATGRKVLVYGRAGENAWALHPAFSQDGRLLVTNTFDQGGLEFWLIPHL